MCGAGQEMRREGEMMRVRNEAENMWYVSQGDAGSFVKLNDCCSLLSQQQLWWRSCTGRWQRGAGPGEGAAAAPLFITESGNSSPRKWPKRYHAARFKEPITKQRGNLETNCDAFKFPTSNTRDGSVPQVDYVRLALPWQPVQCAFQVEFLNFYIDVHNIWEGTFAFSIFTICGGDAFSNFLWFTHSFSFTFQLKNCLHPPSCRGLKPAELRLPQQDLAERPLPYYAEDGASCLNMTCQMNDEGR